LTRGKNPGSHAPSRPAMDPPRFRRDCLLDRTRSALRLSGQTSFGTVDEGPEVV
jgi:hypothetical protein